MNRKAALASVVATLALWCAVGRVLAQQPVRFVFAQPDSTAAVGGSYQVRWLDVRPDDVVGDPASITWYYSPNSDGSARRRMVTYWSEAWTNGLRNHWQQLGPFGNGWSVRQDPAERVNYLASLRDAGPIVCAESGWSDSVLSVRARPRGVNAQFSVGFGVQPAANKFASCEVRFQRNALTVTQCGNEIFKQMLLEVRPQSWYWFELGLRTRRERDIELRVRVWDDARKTVLLSKTREFRPQDRCLLRPGGIMLSGTADFGEIYVDPWAARWTDDAKDEVKWNSVGVPDGDYYLIAELSDGRTPPRLEITSYQVQVRSQ